jgi:hypothetical protein
LKLRGFRNVRPCGRGGGGKGGMEEVEDGIVIRLDEEEERGLGGTGFNREGGERD